MEDYLGKVNTPRVFRDSYICHIGKCRVKVRTGRELLSHYGRIHRTSKNFSSECLHSSECFHQSLFTSFDGLYKHLKKFHSSFFKNKSEIGDSQAVRHENTQECSQVTTGGNDVQGKGVQGLFMYIPKILMLLFSYRHCQ